MNIKEVLKSELPVLVDFWAPWCAPCRMVTPVVEQLADENSETASAYGIMSIPTLGIFKNGNPVDRVVGAVPQNVLAKKLDEHVILLFIEVISRSN
ncbi:MAG: thioredoxin domain-containing protein [Bacteroidota bacterium]|nr:thioredoxin domain-containing protein [Bacteroidota bacterium]